MRHVICLIGWLRKLMNLRPVLLILSHPTPLHLNHTPIVFEIYHCSDHGSNPCPYYIFVDGFAWLSSILVTINEQQIEFSNFIGGMTYYMWSPLSLALLYLMLIYIMMVHLSYFKIRLGGSTWRSLDYFTPYCFVLT